MTQDKINKFASNNGNALFGLTYKDGTKILGMSLVQSRIDKEGVLNLWDFVSGTKLRKAVSGETIALIERLY